MVIFLGKNDVWMEAGQCLTDGWLIKAFRTSDIFKRYRFIEEAMRRATAIDFVTHTESDLDDQILRGNSPTYLRSISRISQNEINEKRRSNWWTVDTYDHTRWMPRLDRYNEEIDEMIRKEHIREESTKSI